MTDQKATNITWHHPTINRESREEMLKQKGAVLWFTGLPSSGKSTLAHEVEYKLRKRGQLTYVLDGDNVRHRLNKNLGFSPEDRKENIRRIGEVAHLFFDAGVIVMTAFISPYREDRELARSLIEEGRFFEIHVSASLEACEQRDPKGLFKKARKGEIKDFTGVSAPYEAPEDPELVVETDKLSIDDSANRVVKFLEEKGII